ncbi:porin [Aquabacterium sp.]|uniref:porin n=1 Tax=Aquabacterium sp. TaxID=1872578 RepID=UPI0025C41AD2|nr:porin [Aquabacterium sp.]
MLSAGSGLVQAQSVTVYGALDAGITIVSNEGGARNTKLDDSVSIGNRLGFKGVEDLGGGLKASFILENGFRVDNGALRQGGTMFGRQSLVGLSGDWGTLSLGNQYDFIADYTEEFNVSAFASGYAIHQGDFDRFNMDRFKNSVKYSSPTVQGFNVGAQYAFGETAGSLRAGSSWSAGAHYTSGAFTTGLAISRLNNPSGLAAIYPYWAIGVTQFLGQTVATDAALPVDSQTIVALGAQYAEGPLALMANTTATTFKGYGTESTMHVYEVGGTWNFTPAVQAQTGFQHTTFEGHRWNQLSAGLSMALSKRTAVYISGDVLQASKDVDAVIGYSFGNSTTNRQSDIRVGMRHKF